MTVDEFMENEWDFKDDLPHTDEFGVTRRNVRPLPSLRWRLATRLRAGSPTPVLLTVGIGLRSDARSHTGGTALHTFS